MHRSIVARWRVSKMLSPSSWSHVSTLPLGLHRGISITIGRAGVPQPGELIAVEIEVHEQFRRAIDVTDATRFAFDTTRVRLTAALLVAAGDTETGIVEVPACPLGGVEDDLVGQARMPVLTFDHHNPHEFSDFEYHLPITVSAAIGSPSVQSKPCSICQRRSAAARSA